MVILRNGWIIAFHKTVLFSIELRDFNKQGADIINPHQPKGVTDDTFLHANFPILCAIWKIPTASKRGDVALSHQYWFIMKILLPGLKGLKGFKQNGDILSGLLDYVIFTWHQSTLLQCSSGRPGFYWCPSPTWFYQSYGVIQLLIHVTPKEPAQPREICQHTCNFRNIVKLRWEVYTQ